MTKITEKKCRCCGKTKSRDAFNKNKKMPDGLTLYCKPCLKIKQAKYIKKGYVPKFYQTYELHKLGCSCEKCDKKNKLLSKNQQEQDETDRAEKPKFGNWNQIDSVIRELAELQSGINDEEANCEKRISLIKKYSDELIEPLLTHQVALQVMLLDFLKKDGRKRIIRKYDFGVIKLFRGQLKIQVNVDLAKQRMGKP